MKTQLLKSTVLVLFVSQAWAQGSDPTAQFVLQHAKKAAAHAKQQQQNSAQTYDPANDNAGSAQGPSAQEIQQSNAAAGLGLNNTDQYKEAQKRLQEAQAQAAAQNTINQGSKKGKKSQSSGAMMNMGASAALMAACMATQPPNIPLCIMGAQAGAQAGADKSAADKSGQTYNASKMGFSNSTEVNETASEDVGSAGFDPKIQEGIDLLKKEGYAVSEAGVTFPDGSFKPNSAFNSAASMAAAGMDPKVASEAAAVLAKMNMNTKEDPNQPRLVSIAVDGAGGGGYSPSGAGDSNADGSGALGSRSPFALSAEERRRMVEGKSMNLAGEPIGVKGDDLFDMVHRAYEKKRKTANFIEDAEMRAPASVKKFKP